MNKFNKILFSVFAVVLTLMLVNCNDDDDLAEVAVSSYGPQSVYPLETVTVQGSNFGTIQFVFVGEKEAPFQLNEDGSMTFTVPEDAEVGMNTVTLAMANNYRVRFPLEVLLTPVPIIKTFDAYAASGETITITGTSFDADYNPIVTIDGVEAPITSSTPTELVVTVPTGISDNAFLDLVVTNDFGSGEATTAFVARHNHLANSTLDEGSGDDFTDWEKLNGGETMTELADSEAYGGVGRSMRVEPAGGNPWDRQFASTPVPLTFGEQYTIILFAKAEEAGAQMRVSVSQWDGNGADYFYGDTVEISNVDWLPYTWTFTVTNDLPTHKVVLDMGMGSVPFGIDHIALVPGVFSAGAGQPELLTNFSFEDGLTGWNSLNGTHDTTTSEAYCGSASLTATGTGGNPWDVQIASDPLEMTEGTDYEISFWTKAAGPDGVYRISMSQWDGNGSDFFYSDDLSIPEDWTYFSFVVNAANVPSGEYRLLFDMGATTQTFFVDAVSVKEYEVPTGLNANGGFEDGLTGWNSLNGTHDVSTIEFRTGSASMTATGTGGNPWDVQMASDPMDMTEGNDYKISFWAKAAGPDGVFRISMSQWDGNGSDFFYSDDLSIPEDWTYYTFVVNAAPVPSGEYRLLFDMGATTQTFFVDDVSVVEYDACE